MIILLKSQKKIYWYFFIGSLLLDFKILKKQSFMSSFYRFFSLSNDKQFLTNLFFSEFVELYKILEFKQLSEQIDAKI